MEPINSDEQDAIAALGELAALGASCAAQALGMILGREIVARSPRAVDEQTYLPDPNWGTGVIFEADGELSGLIALLLPEASRVRLAEQLVGGGGDGLESALRELGNIVASHTVSAIADGLGARILLSVPILVMEDAESAVVSMIGQRDPAHCFESQLVDESSQLTAALVFIPDRK
jgi:chemotaxis protein CheY-P-specific phosphatase CheC